MRNKTWVTNGLDFERLISGMEDRTLLEFVARQNYETSLRFERHDKRITLLEKQNKKMSSLFGGIAGLTSAIIVGVANHFIRN